MNNLSREKKKKIGTEKKNYFEFFYLFFSVNKVSGPAESLSRNHSEQLLI